MARGKRSEHDPNRSGTREAHAARQQRGRDYDEHLALRGLLSAMDPDEAFTGPINHGRFITPDYIKDSRSLLEQDRLK